MPRPRASDLPKATKPLPKKKAKANGYKFPDRLPAGEVLKDIAKKEWTLGESIGQGGFGEIYCASEGGKTTWSYVIKIEPHENGPLFMEKNFYMKFATPDKVNAWKKKERITNFGMPVYLGSGTHMCNGTKYRFLVMDRYGKDLWSLFLKAKTFPEHTVYKCAIQIIDTLRYIHSIGYVHGDIKGANLLLGIKPGTTNTVFLVDFGLACKFSVAPFQRDPKQAHNGTIEYTSCDAHMGVPTRRGDLEILGFNLLHWLAGSLPWEKDIANKETVHKKKEELTKNLDQAMAQHFPTVSKVMNTYMKYVSSLRHDQEPDYSHCKKLFTDELKRIGASMSGPLDFEAPRPMASTSAQKSGRQPRKRVVAPPTPGDGESDDENLQPLPSKAKARAPKPRVSRSSTKAALAACQTDSESDSDGDSIISSTPSPIKRPSPAPAPKASKRTKTAAAVTKPSWRDAPTVQRNLGNKAGEYVKKPKK
ncbi:serine threonine-protein kinase [Nesidiocoris tenuis]|uniref:non-specific serine/threonine protein kinase n=1 Tax=Nesidiocoris tenuis TaxID=355587 RepID=A0ABN7A676_9HEMI|nr:serine threonine-protein kinase [Nesidiocoris tenuis]